jgi:hypothetical protein
MEPFLAHPCWNLLGVLKIGNGGQAFAGHPELHDPQDNYVGSGDLSVSEHPRRGFC